MHTVHTPKLCNIQCTVGWSVDFFLIGQNRSTNQRSGMILEVQIQIFWACAPAQERQSLHFPKIQGGPNIIIF